MILISSDGGEIAGSTGFRRLRHDVVGVADGESVAEGVWPAQA